VPEPSEPEPHFIPAPAHWFYRLSVWVLDSSEEKDKPGFYLLGYLLNDKSPATEIKFLSGQRIRVKTFLPVLQSRSRSRIKMMRLRNTDFYFVQDETTLSRLSG
jgi:hypothetical protein